MVIQPITPEGYTMSVHFPDATVRDAANEPATAKCIYRWPVLAPHVGGHREPETEHEKQLLAELHYLLQLAENRFKHAAKNLPFLREAEFLLEHGRFYTPRPLPKGLKAGRQRGCYLVSQLHAGNTADLTYVEGYGQCSGFCHPHAWCVDAEGEVIDRTWTGRTGRPVGQAYFGVPLDRAYVKELLLARKYADAFLMPAAFAE